MTTLKVPAGFLVRYFDTIGSTNDAAKAAAQAGTVDGSVFWTTDQNAGRGTHGREWVMPPGNLAVSIVRRPRIPIRFASQGALVAAVAVSDALVQLGVEARRIRLKWPNDVLVDGAKISGILLEGEADGPATRWLIVGTGLNLVHHPPETRHPATNLAAIGISVGPEVALSAYLFAFDHWWQRWRQYDFQVIASAWLARTLHKPGDTLKLSQGHAVAEVVYRGLAPDGALVVEGADGVEKRIVSGEIFTPAL